MNSKYAIIYILFVILSLRSETIIVDGIERSYTIHIPANYDHSRKLTLIIALHGAGGSGKGMIRLSGFNDYADKFSFAIVYSDGIEKSWNDGREISKKYVNGKEVDDVKFISCLIDTLESRYDIDSSKIFVTGISNGGIMSFRLACELSDKIAGIATVAASMSEFVYNNCKPTRKIPVMIIFGDEDPLVPFNGGEITILFRKRGKVVSVESSVDFWVKFNNCSSVPDKITIDSVDDDTKAERYFYSGKDGADVVYWLIKGGGHCWPGGRQYLPEFIIGRTSGQINAREEICKFFKFNAMKKQ